MTEVNATDLKNAYQALGEAQARDEETYPPNQSDGLGELHQVVCGVLIREGKVLLCHRSPQKRHSPNVWDFAGGHIEAGETTFAALKRELYEELGIVIGEAQFLRETRTTEVSLSFWRVTEWEGEVSNAAPEEHDDLGWFAPKDLKHLILADSFYPELIAEALS